MSKGQWSDASEGIGCFFLVLAIVILIKGGAIVDALLGTLK